MTIEFILITIIASLLSGLLGVFVSFHFFRRLEQRRLKMGTAQKLFGGKYNIASKEFQEAMNEVMLIFSDSDLVIAAMEEFWTILQAKDKHSSEVANDKLVKLMKAICTDIGIKYKNLSDAYFLRNFSVPTVVQLNPNTQS